MWASRDPTSSVASVSDRPVDAGCRLLLQRLLQDSSKTPPPCPSLHRCGMQDRIIPPTPVHVIGGLLSIRCPALDRQCSHVPIILLSSRR